ncbi:DNA sulfur modification protein DndD [Pontiellaceae bacterium B1224]|nr:DNA sulfur modification protein DndD [Pontiellaceae bacterium B1224]
MIFLQLTLQNFGQYRGFHEVQMGTTKTKPILLIGGHNGGGKTTILDAMQLCLYGKRSNCYGRSERRWDTYLRSWINRDSDPKQETRIKLHFRHPHEGRETDFRIEFSWRSTGKSISERKEVYINDTLHNQITETWDKFIDSILPARLSTLFFFDGEQIENLVRPETAKIFLESAVSELLGIGTLDQLHRDLTTLNRNKSLQNKSAVETQKLRDAEVSYEETQKQVCHTEDHLVILRKHHKGLTKQLEVLESEYESKGGKLLDDQTSNEKIKEELERQIETLNRQIIKEESGELPLHLVKGQLKEIKAQTVKEAEAKDCAQQQQQIERMHGKYLRAAQKTGASEEVLTALSSLADKEKIRLGNRAESTSVYLNLNPSTVSLLKATLKTLPSAEKHCRNLKKQRSDIDQRIKKLEAKLDATPEKGALNTLLKKRRELTKELSKSELEIITKEELLEQLRAKAGQQKDRVVRLLGDSATEKAQYEDDERTVFYSLKAQEYLKEFRTQLLNKHLGKLEIYILESFQHLIKKQSLVHRLRINPSTFSIELTNNERKIIPAEKLSAGERQLLAIAVFWGLQKASSRPIPVMIDTPMGRLDSSHRENLVKRYFPFAAHQLVLLSTDEEIVGDYYKKISTHTHHELTIAFDEEKATTHIKEGYFQ